MTFAESYLRTRFAEIASALARGGRWGAADPVLNVYLAGYLVVMVCGVFEDCIEHLVRVRAEKPGDVELATFVSGSVGQRFRNPNNEALVGLLRQFGDNYRKEYLRRVSSQATTALDSIVNNKNWLAHGETSKMELTVSDVEAYFVRCLPLFEVLESILR